MSYLLDTHVLLWVLFSDEKLSKRVKEILLYPRADVLVSVISLWELSIKYRIGKLKLRNKYPDEIPSVINAFGFNILGLDPFIASSYFKLPKIRNKDPFDNMLAWQAINENLTLLSKDKSFDDYQKQGLKRFW